jgi:hypothetical protein
MIAKKIRIVKQEAFQLILLMIHINLQVCIYVIYNIFFFNNNIYFYLNGILLHILSINK